MNPEDDVIDRIDELVNESLAKSWDEISGYDNDINQPRCRCGSEWHGLPTRYCPGTDFEGPLRRFNWEMPGSFARLFRRLGEIQDSFIEMGVSARRAVGVFQHQIGTFAEGGEISPDEPQTPQQRALPRPSTTPPMWAQQPNQRRRNRRP